MPAKRGVLRVLREARQLMTTPDSVPLGIMRLMDHPRNKRVRFRSVKATKNRSTGRRVDYKSFIVDQNLCYDGITNPMGEVFWTSFAAPTVRDKGKTKSARTSSGCYCGGKGKEHGTRVHEGLQKLIMAIRKPPKNESATGGLATVDPCAYRILAMLVKNRIVPIFSEFIIFDEYTGLATAIDCVAWDVNSGACVAIEVKTGHVDQRDYGAVLCNAHFRPPMDCIPDSALNRAATQLMLSMLIVARRYGVQFDRGIVVRPLPTNNEVQILEMPHWSLDHDMQQNMYAQLRAFVTSGANARRLMKRTDFGSRHRTAVERQEVAQTVREAVRDPASDVFWTPRELRVFVPPAVKRKRPAEEEPRRVAPKVSEDATPARTASSVSTRPASKPVLLSRGDLTWRSELARKSEEIRVM